MRKPEEAFEALLTGEQGSAAPEVMTLATLASALAPSERSVPDPKFKARLRSELLARATEVADAEQASFAALLEDGLVDTLKGAVATAPAELRQLVMVAKALEPAALPAPTPGFRYQLRNRLAAGAPTIPVAARTWAKVGEINTRMRRSLRLVGATGMAAMVMATGSASVAASANALPVDKLYPIKMMKERAELVFPSGAAEGFIHLEHARTRLGEVRAMLDRPVAEQAPYVATLRKMDDQTTIGQTAIFKAFDAKQVPESAVEQVDRFARAQLFDLAGLRERLPAGARPAATDSLTVIAQVIQRADAFLDCNCNPDPNARIPNASGPTTGDQTYGCACTAPSGTGPSGGSGGTSGGQNGNGQSSPPPDPDDPNPPTPGPNDPPRIIPDVPGTADDELDELVNDILNEVPTPPASPPPTPDPTLPPAPTPSVEAPTVAPTVSVPPLPVPTLPVVLPSII